MIRRCIWRRSLWLCFILDFISLKKIKCFCNRFFFFIWKNCIFFFHVQADPMNWSMMKIDFWSYWLRIEDTGYFLREYAINLKSMSTLPFLPLDRKTKLLNISRISFMSWNPETKNLNAWIHIHIIECIFFLKGHIPSNRKDHGHGL